MHSIYIFIILFLYYIETAIYIFAALFLYYIKTVIYICIARFLRDFYIIWRALCGNHYLYFYCAILRCVEATVYIFVAQFLRYVEGVAWKPLSIFLLRDSCVT